MLSYNKKMLNRKQVYDEAYKKCMMKYKLYDCDKFMKLDFKLRNCRTTKCKSFYKKKIKSLRIKKSRKKNIVYRIKSNGQNTRNIKKNSK